MVKKDKKAKEAEKKARKAKKQNKTERKHVQKEQTRNTEDGEDDVDIDQVLAEYARQQESFLKVTEQVCEPPSARSSATFIGSPENRHELFVFGGEYFNGSLAKFFNDLFIYNVRKDEWRQVTSPNSPLPRSGHAWCRGGNTSTIYMFGGEFSSPKQGTFYHYNDFWILDPSSREWARIEGKGKDRSPPARSGHRMTYFKDYIVLFGGFQDTSNQTKYLQDLWFYDCQSFSWHCPALPPASQKPDARSSFTFLPHESGAVLYGGYSRVKTSASNKGTEGAGVPSSSHIMKPLVHQDAWFLRITPPPAEAGLNAPPTARWERRKRPTNAPVPPRAGATMVHHRGRGIQFGGVHDVESSEEGIDSEFFNTLFVWNIDRNRFFSLGLRRPRATPRKQAPGPDRGKRGRAKADEEALLQNLAALQAKDMVSKETLAIDDPTGANEEEEIKSKPVTWEMPHSRFNAHLPSKTMWEYTFDQLWSIDLGKLDGVKDIFKRELEDWVDSDEEESGDEDDEDDDDASSEDESGNEEEYPKGAPRDHQNHQPTGSDSTDCEKTPSEDIQASESALSDALPHPRPFEKMRDFFTRTSSAWQELLTHDYRTQEDQQQQTMKELRKQAFERAEEKWWDCREEVRALEDEQEAAGIGEVVSVEDKTLQSAAGRRR